jgi:hypothetical protein
MDKGYSRWNFLLSYELSRTAFKNDIGREIYAWTDDRQFHRTTAVSLSPHMACYDFGKRTAEWSIYALRSMPIAQAAGLAGILP